MKIKLKESEIRELIVEAINKAKKEHLKSKPITLKLNESDLKQLIKNILTERDHQNSEYIDLNLQTNEGLPFTVVGEFGDFYGGERSYIGWDLYPKNFTNDQIDSIQDYVDTIDLEAILTTKFNERINNGI